MPCLSDLIVEVRLPLGNRAVYAVPPDIASRPRASNVSPNQWAIDYGTQIAHEHNGRWYEPGGPLRHAWHEITDAHQIALLERACPCPA